MALQDVPLPDAVFAKLPPGRAIVMGHSIGVDSGRWQRDLAARGLPAPTGLLKADGTVQISRRDLFEIAEMEATPEHALQLLYASLAWGLGTTGSHMAGRLDGVARDHRAATDLLVRAWKHVRDGADPQVCYEDLITSRGAGRIHGNGPAFASKFLYFAHGTRTLPRCVILDRIVAGRLRDLGVWPKAGDHGWFPSTYAGYCDLMSRWAADASNRVGNGVAADEVEYALFTG